jgi:GAF domain-containing protein
VSSSGACHSASGPPPDPAAEPNADGQSIVARQAALGRLATLAGRGASNERRFAAVCQELARLVGADAAAVLRFDPDATITLVAGWNAGGEPVVAGESQPANTALRRLRDSARPLRCGPSDVPLTGPFIAEIRKLGIRAAVAVPIQVHGRVWGVSVAASRSPEPLPAATEGVMLEFARLLTAAIANADSGEALRGLAEQKAGTQQT